MKTELGGIAVMLTFAWALKLAWLEWYYGPWDGM